MKNPTRAPSFLFREREKNIMYKNKLSIVGTYFRGKEASQVLSELQKGTKLRLNRDPQNVHDSNAIEVLCENNDSEICLGYVAKELNTDLAKLLDEGVEMTAHYLGSKNFIVEEVTNSPENNSELSEDSPLIVEEMYNDSILDMWLS